MFDALRTEILGGTIAPGEKLSSERKLAEEFEVNRHAVREALKRLEQGGLVRITHGGATRVLDWRDTGGLEVLLDLGGTGIEAPAGIVRSVLEIRASIGSDAARLCAERGTVEERALVGELGAKVADRVGGDQEELFAAFGELWMAIIVGSANLAYRLSLNSLLRVLAGLGDVGYRILPDRTELVTKMADAVAAGDPETAFEAATEMLRGDVERVL